MRASTLCCFYSFCAKTPGIFFFFFFTEGADSDTYWDDLGRQMRGDKKCPLNGVQPVMAESGRRVPESEAWGHTP